MLQKIVSDRQKNYELAQGSSREILLISDAYYRNSIDTLSKAKAEFYSVRAGLEQFVGHDVFTQFEDEINSREKDTYK